MPLPGITMETPADCQQRVRHDDIILGATGLYLNMGPITKATVAVTQFALWVNKHDNDPDKVRCTGQMLWNLANLRPSQYNTFIAAINADNSSQESVGSVANKLRNFESMINGLMQAHVSAVVKELKQEFKEEMRGMKEEMRKINAAPVRITGPKVGTQCPPARERGYTP
ncbi:hypothetical protein TURU_075673 [Turdus rufiventris]|nr:hypothetical protein TURU_075673 [Turdus rufiventris]